MPIVHAASVLLRVLSGEFFFSTAEDAEVRREEIGAARVVWILLRWLMQSCVVDSTLYYSPLALEPDLADLVEMFVAELAERLASIRRAVDEGDCQAVAFLAHQIKGAGGSYGFEVLSAGARELETAAKMAQAAEQLQAPVERFGEICRRVRAGQPAN